MREVSRASKSALALLVLGLCAAAYAAPAPVPRTQRAPRLPARCTMIWHGTAYEAVFAPGGHYSAWDGRSSWSGTWRLEGRLEGRRLCVEERLDGAAGTPFRWSVELDRRLRRGPGVRLEGR